MSSAGKRAPVRTTRRVWGGIVFFAGLALALAALHAGPEIKERAADAGIACQEAALSCPNLAEQLRPRLGARRAGATAVRDLEWVSRMERQMQACFWETPHRGPQSAAAQTCSGRAHVVVAQAKTVAAKKASKALREELAPSRGAVALPATPPLSWSKVTHDAPKQF